MKMFRKKKFISKISL